MAMGWLLGSFALGSDRIRIRVRTYVWLADMYFVSWERIIMHARHDYDYWTPISTK
jgi:hypothetical protein